MYHVLILFVWRMDDFLSLGGRSRLTAKGVVGRSTVPTSPFINRGLGFTSYSVHSAQSQINTGYNLIPHVN